MNRVLLRWIEGPDLSSREEPVHVLQAHLSEAIISSDSKLNEHTEVQLIGQGYREAGVVVSCRADGSRFVITIRITSVPEMEALPYRRDPGVLAVENFITDEEADQILDELDRELGPDYDEFSACHRSLAQLCATIRLLRFSRVLNRLSALQQVAGPRLNRPYC